MGPLSGGLSREGEGLARSSRKDGTASRGVSLQLLGLRKNSAVVG